MKVLAPGHCSEGGVHTRMDEMQLSGTVHFMDQKKRSNHWDGPRIADAFNLVAINVSGTKESPQVDVLFKWDGEREIFGMRFPVRRDDPAIIGEEDGHISASVEEHLAATSGMGIESAHRNVVNSLAWLSWGASGLEGQHTTL